MQKCKEITYSITFRRQIDARFTRGAFLLRGDKRLKTPIYKIHRDRLMLHFISSESVYHHPVNANVVHRYAFFYSKGAFCSISPIRIKFTQMFPLCEQLSLLMSVCWPALICIVYCKVIWSSLLIFGLSSCFISLSASGSLLYVSMSSTLGFDYLDLPQTQHQ